MNNKLYKIERPIYTFEALNKDYPEEGRKLSLMSTIRYRAKFKKQSVSSILRLILPLPFILLSFYKTKYIVYDFIAGFTMVIFHIPQGLAYGLLSGLQPINGLYASFYPPIVYSILGTSRHISIGTFSIMSLLSSVPVLREAKLQQKHHLNGSYNVDEFEKIKLQISLSTTLLTGIIQVILGMLQFGCLMNFMSDALIDGFTSAAALHVVMSQLENMLGYSILSYSGVGELPYKAYLFIRDVSQIQLPTVIVSVICILLLAIVTEFINPIFQRKFRFPLPIQFIIVVLGILIFSYTDLSTRFKIEMVGPVPKGLPPPTIPDVTHWNTILADAMLLAVIGFVMNSSLVKIYSLKLVYDVNYNQEAVAYGICNIVGSFFLCTISAAALARTAVAVQVGMKSQIASLVSCSLMLLILFFIGPLFKSVPKSLLSAIIVVSLKSLLLKIGELPKLWYLSKYDFVVCVVAYLSTALLNVPFGLVSGFIFSLTTVLIRIQYPKSQILGRIDGTDIYKNIKVFKDAQEIPGIKIFRYDAPLYFANAEHFQSRLYKKTGLDPTKTIPLTVELIPKPVFDGILVERPDSHETTSQRMRVVIIDCGGTNYIDNVGIRIMNDIYKSYGKIDVSVLVASPNEYCRSMLQRANFAEQNRGNIIFVTVHDAVLSTDTYETEIVEL